MPSFVLQTFRCTIFHMAIPKMQLEKRRFDGWTDILSHSLRCPWQNDGFRFPSDVCQPHCINGRTLENVSGKKNHRICQPNTSNSANPSSHGPSTLITNSISLVIYTFFGPIFHFIVDFALLRTGSSSSNVRTISLSARILHANDTYIQMPLKWCRANGSHVQYHCITCIRDNH